MNSIDIQRTFKALPGLFLLVRPDRDFTIAAASEEFLRATRADAGIVGRPLFGVLPDHPAEAQPAGARNLRAALERVLAARAAETLYAQRYDLTAPRTSGANLAERYWTFVNSPVLTDTGEVEYVLVRVEDAIAQTSRDAIDVLDCITEGFCTFDREWRFGFVNREAHGLLGRASGELSGEVLWQAFPGLEGSEFERNYRHTMQHREKTSFTAFYPPHRAWYEVTAFPVPDGIAVYFRDVTEQRTMQAERERLIAESERQRRIYETVLDSTPDLIYVFDLAHRVIYANAALLNMWGVDDAYGKKLAALGYEQWHYEMHDREIEEVIATRKPIRNEVPFTGTNGRRIYDYIFAPVFGPEGDVVAIAGTTRDITERQAAEQAMREQAERLAESDRAKDEFLATLSHELRNPLAPLRNSIALLRRSAGEAQAAPIHAMMERQVNHLVRLVDDLLEVSRLNRGTLSLRKERVELVGVVRNAVETCEPSIRAAGHSLAVELPREPLWVDGDPVRLAQVLANLLDNAAKYTESGGHIVLSVLREGGEAMLRVVDDGSGIAAETLPRLFRMFSRGERSGSGKEGLGIGLALSLRLVEMHGGTLAARSDGVGTGSEFTVRLPLVAAPQQEGEGERRGRAPDLARMRVLVVDDNQDARESMRMILGLLGADVRVAASGAEALAALADFEVSVVLLDIGMPGMDGYEVARAIRSRFADRDILLVALTGWGQEEDRRRAREAGFDHHLVKPADIEALQKLLRAVDVGESRPA